MELAEASRVEPLGGGRYGAELDPGWVIATKPHGGYLMAVLCRAAVAEAAIGAAADLPHPAAVSAHFLVAADPGPAEVSVEVLRQGRTASQARATVFAGGRRCVEALVTCGRLAPAAEPYWSGVRVPELPAEEDCPLVPASDPRFTVPVFGEVEVRLDPATAGFADDRPAMAGEIRGWARMASTPPDPYAVLVALDILPPAPFDLGLTGSWVPTMELTAYLRALPADGPLRVRQRARLVTETRVDEDCHVWDSTGALVGSATQLAGVRLPRSTGGAGYGTVSGS